jgi:hypothetical protein
MNKWLHEALKTSGFVRVNGTVAYPSFFESVVNRWLGTDVAQHVPAETQPANRSDTEWLHAYGLAFHSTSGSRILFSGLKVDSPDVSIAFLLKPQSLAVSLNAWIFVPHPQIEADIISS